MTTSQIRCLLAVLALSEAYEHIESKNVAHLIGVKKPTVHHTLALLQQQGLIDKELYGDVQLTQEGLNLAHTLETQRDDISLLFSRQFELSPDESAKAALALMSELTEESLDKLCQAK